MREVEVEAKVERRFDLHYFSGSNGAGTKSGQIVSIHLPGRSVDRVHPWRHGESAIAARMVINNASRTSSGLQTV